MKLNLGAGKVILPDWINIDKFPIPGIEVVCNLFTFPWPFRSEGVEEMYISHLIEHIPHDVFEIALRESGDTSTEVRRSDLDGFFRFFQEAWRVLTPGGTVTCIAPYWTWAGSVWDPTHVRGICEQTFTYLTDNHENANFDYHIPFNFSIQELRLQPFEEWENKPVAELDFAMKHLVNAVAEIHVVLKKEPLGHLAAHASSVKVLESVQATSSSGTDAFPALLATTVSNFRAQVAELHEAVAKAEAEVREQERQCQLLREQLADQERELRAAQEALANQENSLLEREKQLQVAQDEVASQKTRLLGQEEQLRAAEEAVANQERQLAGLHAHLAAVENGRVMRVMNAVSGLIRRNSATKGE